eukprot:2996367-Amphidinium_carterae.1
MKKGGLVVLDVDVSNEIVLLDVLVEVEVLLDNGERRASAAVVVEVDVVVLVTMVVTCTEVVCGQRDQARVDARDERFRPRIIPHGTPCGCGVNMWSLQNFYLTLMVVSGGAKQVAVKRWMRVYEGVSGKSRRQCRCAPKWGARVRHAGLVKCVDIMVYLAVVHHDLVRNHAIQELNQVKGIEVDEVQH